LFGSLSGKNLKNIFHPLEVLSEDGDVRLVEKNASVFHDEGQL
jgi:hypothetical protein